MLHTTVDATQLDWMQPGQHTRNGSLCAPAGVTHSWTLLQTARMTNLWKVTLHTSMLLMAYCYLDQTIVRIHNMNTLTCSTVQTTTIPNPMTPVKPTRSYNMTPVKPTRSWCCCPRCCTVP